MECIFAHLDKYGNLLIHLQVVSHILDCGVAMIAGSIWDGGNKSSPVNGNMFKTCCFKGVLCHLCVNSLVEGKKWQVAEMRQLPSVLLKKLAEKSLVRALIKDALDCPKRPLS